MDYHRRYRPWHSTTGRSPKVTDLVSVGVTVLSKRHIPQTRESWAILCLDVWLGAPSYDDVIEKVGFHNQASDYYAPESGSHYSRQQSILLPVFMLPTILPKMINSYKYSHFQWFLTKMIILYKQFCQLFLMSLVYSPFRFCDEIQFCMDFMELLFFFKCAWEMEGCIAIWWTPYYIVMTTMRVLKLVLYNIFCRDVVDAVDGGSHLRLVDLINDIHRSPEKLHLLSTYQLQVRRFLFLHITWLLFSPLR